MESTIARWHVQGWNVAFRDGYVVFDDRILNTEIIRRLPSCPDTVVLGSSRCMQLREEYFPGQTFFNHAMRRAVLEDLVGIWQLYRRRGWRPKRALIGVDAWLLDETYWKNYWQPLRSAFEELRSDWKLPEGATAPDDDANAIPGVNRWKRVAASMTAPLGWKFFKTGQENLTELVRRKDGSVSYHAAFRERGSKDIVATIRNSQKLPSHPLSSSMSELLEKFIARLRSDGVEISFVIPPYHPTFLALNGRNESGKAIAGYEDYLATLQAMQTTIARLAVKHQAQVIGSFYPAAFAATENEFFDWMHPKPPVFERILRTAA